MKLNKIQMQEFLAAFHINDTIAAWDELVHIEFFSGASFVLKQYFRVHTKKKSYILKMLSLPMCSKEVLERQSEISEFYRMNGVPTPKRFQSKQGTYLWTWNNGKYEIDISIEEDFGDMISVISEETIDFMGHLLGKMHALSITNDCHFRLGSLYSEFCKGDVDYLKLWNRTGTDFLPKDLLDEILRKYYRHMDIVKSVWQTLPRYTVQADVYRMNMLIKNEECSIIDYDRAGDEVLLADMLVTWFRFRFDPFVRKFFADPDSASLWRIFYEAYISERPLEKEEMDVLKSFYAVFGSVYGTRMLADEAFLVNFEFVKEKIGIILEVLDGYGLQ